MKQNPNPIISCACGCGKTFPKYDPNGRTRRYLSGHQSTTRTARQKMRAARAGRRSYAPLILKDLGKPTYITISPSDPRLFVDPAVQRPEIKPWVNELSVVYEQGGQSPDPITLAERPDGKLSIVDGQQRMWAAWAVNKPLDARVYKSRGLEFERMLFSVLNNRVRVRAEAAVHSWPGKSGQLIRQWAETPESPLFGRVNFGRNNRSPYDGTTLAKSLADRFLPARAKGRINDVLSRLDKALTTQEVLRKAGTFVELYSQVFPGPARARSNPSRALARVCRIKWDGQLRMPLPQSISRIRRINWQHETGGQRSERFIAILETAIDKRWED